MSGFIPTEIQWRKNKANLGYNFRQNLLKNENLIENAIYNTHIIDHYLDVRKIQTIYNNYKIEKKVNNREIIHLWNAVILALWLRKTNFKSN